MSPNAGAWRGVIAGSQPMSTAVHRSPDTLWRFNSTFILWFFFFSTLQYSFFVNRRGHLPDARGVEQASEPEGAELPGATVAPRRVHVVFTRQNFNQAGVRNPTSPPPICTDKKENQIFLIYKEIQSGAVANSSIIKGFLHAQIFPHI
jgi:hypothetical protein